VNHVAASTSDFASRARSLCEQGRWTDVLAFAQRWQAEEPHSAKSFFYQAVAHAALGRFADAEQNYRRALELDPLDFKIWNNLATLLFDALNRPDDATRCLSQALQLDPGNKLGWANLASLHGQLNRHDLALECADRVLALDPHCVEAHLHRARAAQALGKTELVRAASEALAKVPAEKFRRAR
jgi:tetratricopeptide (TPR) repeat protein